MTATDLYEIVRDVPREAWPELDWHGGRWVDGHTEAYTRPELAEQAFVGSMTAWLALKVAYSSVAVFSDGSAQVGLSNRIKSCRASSLVAALAAACKEVGK